MAYGDRHIYRDFRITDQFYGFAYFHKDWDLDDPRCGSTKDLEDAKAEIDFWYAEQFEEQTRALIDEAMCSRRGA